MYVSRRYVTLNGTLRGDVWCATRVGYAQEKHWRMKTHLRSHIIITRHPSTMAMDHIIVSNGTIGRVRIVGVITDTRGPQTITRINHSVIRTTRI